MYKNVRLVRIHYDEAVVPAFVEKFESPRVSLVLAILARTWAGGVIGASVVVLLHLGRLDLAIYLFWRHLVHLRVVYVGLGFARVVGRLIVEVVHLLRTHDSLHALHYILSIAVEIIPVGATFVDQLRLLSEGLSFSKWGFVILGCIVLMGVFFLVINGYGRFDLFEY